MGLFNKKKPVQTIDLKCPVEGCQFVADDKGGLEKHIAWKHPDRKK